MSLKVSDLEKAVELLVQNKFTEFHANVSDIFSSHTWLSIRAGDYQIIIREKGEPTVTITKVLPL